MATWAIHLPKRPIRAAFTNSVTHIYRKNGGKRKILHYKLCTECKSCGKVNTQEGENLEQLKIKANTFRREHLDECLKKETLVRFV